MVKSILLCDLFIFCHNLITWLIAEQCHIFSDTAACSRFSVSAHNRKKWLSHVFADFHLFASLSRLTLDKIFSNSASSENDFETKNEKFIW